MIPTSQLQRRVACFLQKTANFERKKGNTANANAIDALKRAVDKVAVVPAESGCEGNRGSRRRRQK